MKDWERVLVLTKVTDIILIDVTQTQVILNPHTLPIIDKVNPLHF